VALDPNHFVDLEDGRFAQTSADDLANLFLKAGDQNHLVVHFHGGLVSRDSAVKGARQLIKTYQAGGAYPVFFIWNSDLPSVVKGRWHEIPMEELLSYPGMEGGRMSTFRLASVLCRVPTPPCRKNTLALSLIHI